MGTSEEASEAGTGTGTGGPSVTSAMDSATSRASAASPRIAATSAMVLGTSPVTAARTCNLGEMGGNEKYQNSKLGGAVKAWRLRYSAPFGSSCLENFNIYIKWL